MIEQPLDQLRKSIKNALSGVANIRKSFETFFIEAMILYICISGRKNFAQLARNGKSCESRFRQNFQKDFDWVKFNSAFTSQTQGHRKAIAVDPSYIDKSGKHTPGVGYFWSGCANSAKWGLEITDIALVDVDTKEAIHLKAIQTPTSGRVKKGRKPAYLAGVKEQNSLIAWYLRSIAQVKDSLLGICNLIVADAYFSKAPFVDGLIDLGFNLVSRFRNDVSLKYLYNGEKTGKRGRPKVTEGKVNLNELRKDVFKEVTYSDTEGKEATLYTAIVWATSLKRKVQVVIVDCQDPNKKTQTRKTFFSTDLDMSAKDIMDTYKTRFQIEFLLRDAKQFTGLTHCQSRNEKSLDFAFNMSLSTINAVRAYAKENNINLSVANIKTLMHNNMMINQILCKSGCRPDRLLNAKNYRELLFYGVFESA
jgi:hypothetical protein